MVQVGASVQAEQALKLELVHARAEMYKRLFEKERVSLQVVTNEARELQIENAGLRGESDALESMTMTELAATTQVWDVLAGCFVGFSRA